MYWDNNSNANSFLFLRKDHKSSFLNQSQNTLFIQAIYQASTSINTTHRDTSGSHASWKLENFLKSIYGKAWWGLSFHLLSFQWSYDTAKTFLREGWHIFRDSCKVASYIQWQDSKWNVIYVHIVYGSKRERVGVGEEERGCGGKREKTGGERCEGRKGKMGSRDEVKKVPHVSM